MDVILKAGGISLQGQPCPSDIFCLPLTVYGLTYWEHMPAVFLLFAGVAFISNPQGILEGALLGTMCGFAVWLRPEAFIDIFYVVGI
jgi:hypothetical protein